jgi:hypothetical protein
MKHINTRHIFATVLFMMMFAFVLPSCSTTRQSKSDTVRQGLMMQDKAEYRRNKSKYKGSASYKKQVKRNKKLRRRAMRR